MARRSPWRRRALIRAFRLCSEFKRVHFGTNELRAKITIHLLLVTGSQGHRGVGRGRGDGGVLGVGVGLGVAVGVGVGVGIGAPAAQYLPPVLVNPPLEFPPQTIIVLPVSLPVHTAVCDARGEGALLVLVAVHVSVSGMYWPPVLKVSQQLWPPQTIICVPVQTAV
jgi:hypothetical protein